MIRFLTADEEGLLLTALNDALIAAGGEEKKRVSGDITIK
jgi:hypothetical protein